MGLGLDEIRQDPLSAAGAIGVGSVAGGVGTAAVVLGRKHGGKFATNATIMRSAALPLVLGAIGGGAAFAAVAMHDPKYARTQSMVIGGSVVVGGGLGALSGARMWSKLAEAERHGMPMWRFAGSHALSGVAQHAMPLALMTGVVGVVGLISSAAKDD